MKSLSSRYAFVLAASAAMCAGTAAAEQVPQRQRAVFYGDLNLANAHGTKVLYQRLTSAARMVCAPNFDLGGYLRAAMRNCEKDAVTRAVGEVDNPDVTAYHLKRSGKEAQNQMANMQ